MRRPSFCRGRAPRLPSGARLWYTGAYARNRAGGGAAIEFTTFWRGLARPWRWLAWGTGLYLVWVLAAWGLVPPLARSQLTSGLSGALRRPASVERVSLNPFTLALAVEGLSIGEPDGSRTFASCGRILLDLDLLSLPTLTLRASELRVESPFVRLAFTGNGTANFSDLLAGEGGDAARGGEAGGGFPLPVVLRSLAVTGGSLVVDDLVLGKHHEVRDFTLDVPFASSLPEDSAAYVEPTLSATVNGRPVRLRGRTLPFTATRRTEFDFGLDDADLAGYWDYAPVPAGLALTSGRLSCNASVVLEQSREALPVLFVRGGFLLRDLALAGPDGRPLATVAGLDLDLSRFSLLERRLDLSRLVLREPRVEAVLEPGGGLDWAGLIPAAEPGEPATTPGPPFVVSCADLAVEQGRVRFTDRSVPGGFSAELEGLSLHAANATTGPGRTGFTLAAGGAADLRARGDLSLEPFALDAEVSLSGVSLPALAPYLAGALPARVSGVAGLAGRMRIEAGNLVLSGLDAEIAGPALALPGAAAPSLSLDRLALAGAGLDLAGRKAEAATLRLEGGRLTAVRAADGTLDLAGLAPAGKSGGGPERTGEPAWTLDLGRAEVAGLAVDFRDQAAGPAARLSLASLDLALDRPGLDLARPVPVHLAAELKPGGRIGLEGSVVPAGPSLRGRMECVDLPLSLAGPWLPGDLPVRPEQGAISLSGELAVDAGADLAATFSGNASLRSLGLAGRDGRAAAGLAMARADGLRLALPGGRVRAAGVELEDASLPDPEGGRPILSLGRLRAADLDLDPAARAASLRDLLLAAPVARLERDARGLNLARALKAFRAEPGPDRGAGAAPAAERAEPFALRLDRVRVFGGAAEFRDATLRQAVALRLERLTGLGQALSTTPDQEGVRGSWSLNATVEQHAPLVFSGGLLPGPEGLVANGTVTLRGLDLSPLNPYLVAYTAYPADTGRLDAELDLAVSGGALSGESRIRVRGLELGARDGSVQNPAVPIQTAISLLADSDGDLSLDIPLSGRLDDPQYSLGKVIASAMAGMVGKLVTAPFSFLGGIFSLVAERSLKGGSVAFAPGVADMGPEAREALSAVARAMAERPRLEVTAAGVAVAAGDGPARREELFLDKLRARKFRDLKRRRQGPASPGEVRIEPGEYERWLTEAYEADPMDKPRNLLGLVKDQPVEVMERMLRDSVTVGEQELLDLASERAAAVRDFLVAAGVPEDRVFLRAPSLAPEGGGQVRLGLR